MKKRNNRIYLFATLAVIFISLFFLIFFIFSNNNSYISNDENIAISESVNPETDSATKHESASANTLSGNMASETTEDTMPETTEDTIPENMENQAPENTENQTSEGDNSMEHPERVTYHAGFYFEPITEDIKNRIYGLSYKEDCTVPYDDLRYVSVLYKNFNGETDYGEMICNKAIAQDLVEIFYELFENDYPIEKIRLIDEYNADDDLSCLDNNTSCFNYRVVYGSDTLSKHALGMAIDINPFYNPYITYPDGVERISPPGSEPYADREADLPYMIKKGDLCYNLFIEHGFTWGGEWKTLKDYQHFQKVLE